jgi:hypothetical protein
MIVGKTILAELRHDGIQGIRRIRSLRELLLNLTGRVRTLT